MNALFDIIPCQTPLILLPSSWKIEFKYFSPVSTIIGMLFLLKDCSNLSKFFHILHISVYCDILGKGRRNVLPLCCSNMPVNTFVLGNSLVSCVL